MALVYAAGFDFIAGNSRIANDVDDRLSRDQANTRHPVEKNAIGCGRSADHLMLQLVSAVAGKRIDVALSPPAHEKNEISFTGTTKVRG